MFEVSPNQTYLNIDIKLQYQTDKTLGLRGKFNFLTHF